MYNMITFITHITHIYENVRTVLGITSAEDMTPILPSNYKLGITYANYLQKYSAI